MSTNEPNTDAFKKKTRADIARQEKHRKERKVLATTSLIHLIGKKEIV